MARIGVFDSGIGGLSVSNAIEQALPQHDVYFRNDAEHVPYGTKGLDEIYSYTLPVMRQLVNEDKADVIVVACNTVTTNFIARLRDELPVPLVGMEPMVKPAAEATKTGIITVCATPRTLESPRYEWLKRTFAPNIQIIEPDCSAWSYMIENELINRDKIAMIINDSCQKGSDQIVLGCTHYHWIEELIRELAQSRAQVIQPEKPVIEQLKRVLARLT